MSHMACTSALPTAFSSSSNYNVTANANAKNANEKSNSSKSKSTSTTGHFQNQKPPRARSSSTSNLHASMSHGNDDHTSHSAHKYHARKHSHDDVDIHTLATASTAAATSSYSMTDDVSEASEVGMEVTMSNPTDVSDFQSHTFKAGKEMFTIDTRYALVRTIGSGAYGVVISAADSRTNSNVAIKMVPRAFNDEVDAKRILREIKLLKHFTHENIISVVDMMPPQHEYVDDFNDVYIVTDLMETDLHRIIYSKQTLSMDHVQYFVYQVLRGLKYIHSANVIHRDLKPSNLLVNSNCDLKICDFGLARGIRTPGQSSSTMLLTEYVVTRWYRAPEIMLACHEYSKPIDVWSVGCIFAELILRKPYFPGDDYIDQLTIICEKLGKLQDHELDFVTSDKAKRFMKRLPERVPVSMSRQFPGAPRNALELLRQMLQIHPGRRTTTEHALAHSFFSPLHSPQDEPVASSNFDFSFETKERLTRIRLKELIWNEVKHFRPDTIVPKRKALHEA